MQSVTITTQPAIEPVTVSDAKAFMRVDISTDDALIGDLITAAREMAEQYTKRKFINTVLKMTLDGVPGSAREVWWDGVRQGSISELYRQADSIVLPFPPVVSVASFVTYDDANASSTFSASSYRVDGNGYIYLNDGYTWPSDLRDRQAIEINYTAGYGTTAASVPGAIRHAIKITVAAMYEDRTCFSMPATARDALDPYRILEERVNGMR